MTNQLPRYIEVAPGAHARRIATLTSEPAKHGGMGLMWLPGLKSDMLSTKATALAGWASARGIGMTQFDYSGHGQSSGRFEDALIGDWLEEAEAVFTHCTSGPQILVGSSTGGHIALLLLRKLAQTRPQTAERLKGLVLIAPAWDLTEELMWKTFSPVSQREVMEKGYTVLPTDYDPAGYTISKAFIEEGRHHLFGRKPFDPGRPVHILQGLEDTAVPPQHARALAGFLTGGWATLTEVPDAEHRLSRPQDLEMLYGIIEDMIARVSHRG